MNEFNRDQKYFRRCVIFTENMSEVSTREFRTDKSHYRGMYSIPINKVREFIPINSHYLIGFMKHGGCERDIVVHRMNEGYRAWGALKSVLSNRRLGIKAKKCLYEGVIVPTASYGAEAWGVRSAERRKVNILEIKCLRSLVGVSRMDS